MATLHITHGFIGVGKTTFAHRLAAEHDAVVLSIDRWMQVLHGEDPPFDAFDALADRCWVLMREVAAVLLQRGVDVVFDAGHWTRQSRDAARAFAQGVGAGFRLYRLTCPEEEAWRRIETRNANMNPHSVYISPETYAALVERFEPLQADEVCVEVGPEVMR